MSKHHRQNLPQSTQPVAAPPGAWWNAIARKWFVNSETGPRAVDPQPPPPRSAAVSVPLSVKVDL